MNGRVSQNQREQIEISRPTQMKAKVNRLRRSPKPAAQNPSQPRQTVEFKTPTRPPRSRFGRLIADDSPSNEADFQDIVWDTTSPSPIRHGRGRRAANVRAVDISDIANRIAPKNDIVKEAESSLLQWIGDSAIPCTPEVQQPKVKSKQNTVEDLMRLAKQFDFNMRQDETPEQHSNGPGSQSAVEQELLHYDNQPRTPQNGSAIKNGSVGLEIDKANDEQPVDEAACQEMDDDLDFLFDGPTQQLSGRLSQASGYRTQETTGEKNLTGVKACANTGDFDDDWSNDGLLEDSLVFEMTQNPDLFAAPQDCSTQIQTHENKNVCVSNTHSSVVANKPLEAQNNIKCSTAQELRTKNRQSFQLDSHSSYQVQAKPCGGLPSYKNGSVIGNHMEDNYSRQTFSTGKVLPVLPCHSNTSQNQKYQPNVSKTEPAQIQKSLQSSSTIVSTNYIQPNTKAMLPSTSLSTIKPSHSKTTNTLQSLNSGATKQREEDSFTTKDGFSDALDEDLDSFFASDDIWDDEDDDLLCEACDNLEEINGNSVRHVETPASKHQPTNITQPTALQHNTSQNKPYITSKMTGQQTVCHREESVFAQPNPPRRPATNVSMSSANTSASLYRQKAHTVNSGPTQLHSNVSHDTMRPSVPSGNGPYKFTQVRSSSVVGSGICEGSSIQLGHERGVLTPLQTDVRTADSNQFKKPYSGSVGSSTVIIKEVCTSGAVKCSDAEIEWKKKQAMERRRLRMLASQNLRAPI